MAITKQQIPYEFLVRWSNGAVAGAHIRFLERLVEDGTVISEKEGHAMPVSMTGATGFPLADVLSALQASALADLEAAQAAKATAEQALAAEQAAVAALQAQIDAYTQHASVNVQSVTMRQARLALLGAGLLGQVAAAIAELPSPQKEAAQIEWEYASTVERNSGLLPAMGAALGLTDVRLDALFATAKTL